MNDKQSANIPNRIYWFVWGFFVFGIACYLMILQMNQPGTNGEDQGVDKTFVRTLAWVACGNLLISFAIRLLITLPFVHHEDPAKRAYVFPSCIVSWALAEAVAIYGLILGFQGASIYDYSGFFLAGFSALIFLIPNFPSTGD